MDQWYVFATSRPYTVFDPYTFRTGDSYHMDRWPMIRTTDPYSRYRHRVLIVGAINYFSGKKVPVR